MKAVAEHTNSVSTYTENAWTSPCCAGCSTSDAAAACGPVPWPASFEYTPRFTPQPIAAPTPAIGVNASDTIIVMMPGNSVMCIAMMTSDIRM